MPRSIPNSRVGCHLLIVLAIRITSYNVCYTKLLRVVISPLLALMHDQVSALQSQGMQSYNFV